MITLLNPRKGCVAEDFISAEVVPSQSPRVKQMEMLLGLIKTGEGDPALWIRGIEEMNLSQLELSLYKASLTEAAELGLQARIAADHKALDAGTAPERAIRFVEAAFATPLFGNLLNRRALHEATLRQVSEALKAEATSLPKALKPAINTQVMVKLQLDQTIGNEDMFGSRLALAKDVMHEMGYGANHPLVRKAMVQHAAHMLRNDINRLNHNMVSTTAVEALTSTGLCSARQADGLALDAISAWIEAERANRKGGCANNCFTDCAAKKLDGFRTPCETAPALA